MCYLDRFKESYLKERFSKFPEQITDMIDLINILGMHNVFPFEDNVNIYEDNIEVFGLGETLEEYPYFEENFFIIYLPYYNSKGKCVMEIEFVDYNETKLDIKQRNKVKQYLKEVLPNCIDLYKIIFKVRK